MLAPYICSGTAGNGASLYEHPIRSRRRPGLQRLPVDSRLAVFLPARTQPQFDFAMESNSFGIVESVATACAPINSSIPLRSAQAARIFFAIAKRRKAGGQSCSFRDGRNWVNRRFRIPRKNIASQFSQTLPSRADEWTKYPPPRLWAHRDMTNCLCGNRHEQVIRRLSTTCPSAPPERHAEALQHSALLLSLLQNSFGLEFTANI